MEDDGAGGASQEATQMDILFLDASCKARDKFNDGGDSGGRGWKRAVEIVLWIALIGGFFMFIREHVSSVNATRAAGTADARMAFMNSLAQMMIFALVSIRWVRWWMGNGTTVSCAHVRGRIIEMTPRWNEGTECVSVEHLESVIVTDPAFGGRRCMTLTEKNKHRHTIPCLSYTSSLGELAEFCRSVGVSFEQRKNSRVKAGLNFIVITVLFLVLMLTTDPQHPVQCAVEMSGLGLVVLLLGLMNRDWW